MVDFGIPVNEGEWESCEHRPILVLIGTGWGHNTRHHLPYLALLILHTAKSLHVVAEAYLGLIGREVDQVEQLQLLTCSHDALEVLLHLLVVLECLPSDFGDGLQDFIQRCISLTNLPQLVNLTLDIRTEIVGCGVSNIVVARSSLVCQFAYVGVWIIN